MDDLMNQPKPQANDTPKPKRKSWLRRIFLGGVLLVALGACLFFGMVYKTRSNPPYSTALELVLNDEQMIEHLGSPIHDVRWLPTSGYPKQFQMQVEGPKGLADISVTAGEFDGQWELVAVDVLTRNGGKRFSLDTGSGSGSGEAPTWNPGGSSTEPGPSGDTGLQPPSSIELPPTGPPGVEINLPEPSPDLNIELPPMPEGPNS